MKKLLLSGVLLFALTSNAQTVIWTETFENNCSSGCLVSGVNTGNGAWTTTDNSPAIDGCGYPTSPNTFYVSCAENGNAAGACGTTCSGDESLHLGSTSLGDQGASYDSGGSCLFGLGGLLDDTETDIRAESPVINLTGQSNITLNFVYMENGQGSFDDASLWYYDGATWSLLDALAKTTPCGVQGTWTAFSILLPASANGNSNVKIGFKWVNNVDATGSDPSFAVDDIQLTVVATSNTITTTNNVAPSSWCVGSDAVLSVNYTSTGTWNSGNVFSIQLSDATGSFASPTVIGSLASTAASGTVTGTVPGATPAGNGYRVRIVGSDPSTTGSDNSADLVINPLPNVTMTTFADVCVYDGLFTLTGGSPAMGTYSGTGVTANVFDPSAAGVGTHTITYTFTDGNGCSDNETETITVGACSGVIELSSDIVLYPNPATEEFRISGVADIQSVELVDLSGRSVKKFTKGIYSISSVPAGTYMVIITASAGVYQTRIVIE